MTHRTGVALACAAAAWSSSLAAQSSARARILVGPNVLVSVDDRVPHLEPTVAASPVDPKTLVAIAIVKHERDNAAVAYVSRDGGSTWRASALPLGQAGDPQVVIGTTGAVVFAGLGGATDTSTDRGFITARSENLGAAWQPPARLGESWSDQDHPQVALDKSGGRFNGRVYAALVSRDMGFSAAYLVGVYRSADEGRSWQGPVVLDRDWEEEHRSIQAMNPLVLSDGAVWLPLHETTGEPETDARDTSYDSFAISRDGGETFLAPHVFRTATWDTAVPPPAGREGQMPEYAVNDRGAVHRDRIYMVFRRHTGRYGLGRVFLQYSDDRGMTWSAAHQVDASVPEFAEQFQQMVAVDRDGVVGVSWFDTRARRDGSAFDEYFAASVDGGDRFLPAARVSTETTVPRSPANIQWIGRQMSPRWDVDTMTYVAVEPSAWLLDIGGDYMGLTADLDGRFHPVWTDARNGVYQLYTAAIRVADADAVASKPASTVRLLHTSEFSVLLDPATYDVGSHVVSLPIRVKNDSKHPLYAPMTLRLDADSGLKKRIRAHDVQYPAILGATNRKNGPGAEFDLTALMGDDGVLEPGAATGTLILRLRTEGMTGPPLAWMATIVSAGVPR